MSPSLRSNFLMSSRNLVLSCLEKKDWPLIPSLIQRESLVPNTWQYQNETLKWDFDPSDKILDIGSGGYPFSFATHLADKYTEETSHRTEKVVKDSRPFFQADIEDAGRHTFAVWTTGEIELQFPYYRKHPAYAADEDLHTLLQLMKIKDCQDAFVNYVRSVQFCVLSCRY